MLSFTKLNHSPHSIKIENGNACTVWCRGCQYACDLRVVTNSKNNDKKQISVEVIVFEWVIAYSDSECLNRSLLIQNVNLTLVCCLIILLSRFMNIYVIL